MSLGGMRTSSTLLSGIQGTAAVVAALCDVMSRDVTRAVRADAIVAALRMTIGCEHVVVEVARFGGGFDALARTAGTTAVDPRRFDLRVRDRRVGRLETEARGLRRSQRESIAAVCPLVARAILPCAHDGEATMPARASPMAVEHARIRYALTPRECEVLELVAVGHTNADIARMLGCAEGTLEHHVRSLFRKTSVSNRAALVTLFWGRLAAR